nr:MAG TPA: Putative stress-responsive nuclear envelope protein [Caudoviricetes sp.]
MGLSLPKSNLIFLKKCLDKWVHFSWTSDDLKEWMD